MNFFPKRRPTDAEKIEALAAAWLAERDGGLTPEAREQFIAWQRADPRHSAALRRLEQTWSALHSLREYRPTARACPDPDLLSPTRGFPLVRYLRTAVALPFAALLILATVWSFSSPPSGERATEQRFTTTLGGYERVTLDDGSVVELNSSTELRVHYSPGERRVDLLRGEAHFTVATNQRRPFRVAADGITVRAVGTAFDVRVAPQGIEVLVTAGTVQLGRISPSALPPGPAPAPAATPFVTAGWRAFVSHLQTEAPLIEKMASPAVRDLLAWQSSRLVFVEMPLGEVIEQFNQRNQVQLSVADPELAKMPVGGSFAANNVEAFVRLLSSNGDLLAERVGVDQIVLRKAN